MVDLCQLPPLPVLMEEENTFGGLDRGEAEEYVLSGVVAAVVTGRGGELAGQQGEAAEGAAEDFAGWHRRSEPVVAVVAEREVAARVEPVVVLPPAVVRREATLRAVRAAAPQVWRRSRAAVAVEMERGSGRFSSPLVLMGAAVVSMVVLSLASIGMVKDMGAGRSVPVLAPQRAAAERVAAERGATVAKEPAAGVATPVIAGSGRE